MERSRRPSPAGRVALVGIALGLVLLAATSQVSSAIDAAACLERARHETISCGAAPEAWLMILTGALAVGLAILLGFLLAVGRGAGGGLDPAAPTDGSRGA